MAFDAEAGLDGLSRCFFLHLLPNELVDQVIAKLQDDNSTLCALAQTCRHLQPLCEKHLYSIIELRSTRDLQAIIAAFTSRAERVQSVQTLKMLYKFSPSLSSTLEERTVFNEFIPHMKALKNWHVESPYDNFKWEDGGHEWVEHDMEHFRTAIEAASLQQGLKEKTNIGLAKLETLIVHSHGAYADFWDLDGFHCLFRHPTLRYLHASCFTLPSDLPELAPYEKTTPLETLVFDECEIEPKSLGRILRTPKSIKHLTLGENVYNKRGPQGNIPRLSGAPLATIDALSAISSSLETLTHFDPYWKTLAAPNEPTRMKLGGQGLRNFFRLRSVDCDLCSFLHSAILTPMLAPPHLDVLRLRLPRTNPGFFDELPDYQAYTYLSSLTTMELAQAVNRMSFYAREDYICDADRLRERHAYAYKLYKSNINLKLLVEMHAKYTYIPPYLHGEQIPITRCLYDAAEVGFGQEVEDGQQLPVSLQPRASWWEPSGTRDHPVGPSAARDKVETDQLSDGDVLRLRNIVRRTLMQIRSEFIRAQPSSDDDDSSIPDGHIVVILETESDTDEFFDAEDDWEDEDDMDGELYIDMGDAGGFYEDSEHDEGYEEDEGEDEDGHDTNDENDMDAEGGNTHAGSMDEEASAELLCGDITIADQAPPTQ